jgi:hypothetical protein
MHAGRDGRVEARQAGITVITASLPPATSRNAASVSAGAVSRPIGSSMIDADLPVRRSCSAVVKR